MNTVYNPEFIKEAKKTHTNRKEIAETNRKESNFWLFSLAAFTENLIMIWAKASGSEAIVKTVIALQELHMKLLEKCLLYTAMFIRIF